MEEENKKYWIIDYNGISFGAAKEISKKANYGGPIWQTRQPYIEESFVKIDRGLLEYKRYGTKDLARFMQDRGIQLVGRKGRQSMIQALRLADSEQQFSRFLELPLELQFMIYQRSLIRFAEHDEDTYHTPLVPPVQPAMTRLSRATRPTALGVFHNTEPFPITGGRQSLWRHRNSPEPRINFETKLFLNQIAPTSLRSIRHFRFVFGYARNIFQPSTKRLSIRAQMYARGDATAELFSVHKVPLVPDGGFAHREIAEFKLDFEIELRRLVRDYKGLTGRALFQWFEAIMELVSAKLDHND